MGDKWLCMKQEGSQGPWNRPGQKVPFCDPLWTLENIPSSGLSSERVCEEPRSSRAGQNPCLPEYEPHQLKACALSGFFRVAF